MKKFSAVLMAVLIFFCSAVNVSAAKKTVAVMPLENVSGQNTLKVAEIMTEKLMIAIKNSGKYSVLDRLQIATILKEQGFQNVAANPNTAVDVGKLTGAKYSLIGKVTIANVSKSTVGKILKISQKRGIINTLKGKVSADIRFVDNETGELVFAQTFTGVKTANNEEDALNGACLEVAEKLLNQLTANLVGRVADVSGDEIYTDLGADSGIRKGDSLLILRETSPIEINGKIIGMKTARVGRAKVIEVYEEYSVCKIIDTIKSDGVKKGDVIKKE